MSRDTRPKLSSILVFRSQKSESKLSGKKTWKLRFLPLWWALSGISKARHSFSNCIVSYEVSRSSLFVSKKIFTSEVLANPTKSLKSLKFCVHILLFLNDKFSSFFSFQTKTDLQLIKIVKLDDYDVKNEWRNNLWHLVLCYPHCVDVITAGIPSNCSNAHTLISHSKSYSLLRISVSRLIAAFPQNIPQVSLYPSIYNPSVLNSL